MGFNKVYRSLQELFPQIDARVLRAVAIEHSKDVDAAAEAVLMEIIPFLSERSRPTKPLTGSISLVQSSQATTQTVNIPPVNALGSAGGQNDHGNDLGAYSDADNGHNEPLLDAYPGHVGGECSTVGLILSGENLGNTHDEGVESVNKDDAVSSMKCDIEISTDDVPCQTFVTLQDENMNVAQDKVDCSHLETVFDAATDQGNSWADGNNYVVRLSSTSGHDLKTCQMGNTDQLTVALEVPESRLEESKTSLSVNTSPETEISSNIVCIEDKSNIIASVSQSSQIHIMGMLEKIIASAMSNKEALFSGFQSVICLMREVEFKEKAAEQAKLEAAMGRADLLAKLEELKKTVQLTKESNSMHAGEVYGEKAVLTTELRELQSRVLSLSEERDKSLSILDEMRQTLEVRLAAAENEIKLAEQQKLEKEKAAMKELAEHELIMERVVQESKILKQQAEENAKLQEFLMDRGHVVDVLQGELAVIFHDVNLLRESFDENIPFSKSSHTSFVLASSTSSSKNLNPEDLSPDGADSLVAETERDAVSCSPDQLSEGELKSRDDRKALKDDGWELFEDSDVFA